MEKIPPKDDNIMLIIELNRLLLQAVHRAIKEQYPQEKLQREALIAQYAQLFGAKQSLATVLGEVADTELKIEKQRPKRQVQDEPQWVISEKDLALVQHYLDKQKAE